MKKLLYLILLVSASALGQAPTNDSTKLVAPPAVANFTPQFYFRGGNGSNMQIGFNNTLASKWVQLVTGYQFNTYIGTATQAAITAAGTGWVPTSRLVSTGIGLLGGGNLGSNLTLYVDTANIVSKTYSARWLTQAGAASTYTPITRTLTIGTTTADLSANRTFLLGNLTNGIGIQSLTYDGTGSTTVKVDTPNIVTKTFFNTNIGTATAASIATKGSGSVTSITPGYGFTSSTPITTSGTLTIDTTKLQTVLNFATKGNTYFAPKLTYTSSYLYKGNGTTKPVISSISDNGTVIEMGNNVQLDQVGATAFAGDPILSWNINGPGATGKFATLSTTGSGNAVLDTSPTLVTPILGVASTTTVSVTGNPATPASGINIGSSAANAIAFRGANGWRAAFDFSGLSAGRIYTMPDATTTLIGDNTTGPVTFSGGVSSLGKNIALNGGTANAWNANKNSLDIDASIGSAIYSRNIAGSTMTGITNNAYLNGSSLTATRKTVGNATNFYILNGNLFYDFYPYAAAGVSTGGTTPFKVDSLGNQTNTGTIIAQTPAGANTDSVAVKLSSTKKFGAVPVSQFQSALVNTTNIKSVNGATLLGSGNLAITPSNTDTTATGFATRLLLNNYAPLSTTAQILASSPYTAAQTSVGTLITYTVPTTGMYNIQTYISVSAISVNTIRLSVTYTNDIGDVVTANSGTITTAGLAGSLTFQNLVVGLQAGTTVTITSNNPTSGGSNTFNTAAKIYQLP